MKYRVIDNTYDYHKRISRQICVETFTNCRKSCFTVSGVTRKNSGGGRVTIPTTLPD